MCALFYLLKLNLQGNKYFISCPSCRKPTQLPDIGAIDLPTAFFINSLFQLQNTLKNVPHEVNMICEVHHDPLKVFCETCEELICRDCTISQSYQNHKYKLVTECYPDHHQEIETNLTRLKRKVADINAALTNLITREREITKQGEDVKKDIHTQAQLLIKCIQESERQLVQQVDTAVQQKIQLLTKQKEQAETNLNQLKGCEELVEHSLKIGSQQQVLREKQSMVQIMTTVSEDVNPVVFQPIEEANIEFTRNLTLLDSIGNLESKTFHKSVLIKSDCVLGKTSTITLNFQSGDGSPFSVPFSLVSCELSSAGNGKLTKHDISEIQSGSYNISFTPLTKSKYQLIVRLGGVNIPGSPFTLSLKMRGKPVNIVPELIIPAGIVVTTNGEIVVAQNGKHCITIVNKEGKKVKSFGRKGTKKGQFTCPWGVTISLDGHILVTDDHRLQKLTFNGDCVNSVGSSKTGNGPLQFCEPRGITVHPTTGNIFIADTGNCRIQVLNNDLIYACSFGVTELDSPFDVTFDNEGYLYVAECYIHCIKKFASTGQYISKFGSEGSNPGHLDHPTSITTDNNNLVYVTEVANHRVSIFDTNGCLIQCFGMYGIEEEQFNEPHYVAIDSLGNLYISDTDNNRVVIV